MKNRKRPRSSSRPPFSAIRLSQPGRTPVQPQTEPDPVPAQLARINEISMVARTTWFGLLAYLAFVGVTLLGVEDADFFVPSRQTQLPLVNVAIPTSSFFWFAPLLGAALYAYLHLQLLKLWEALAAPPPVIEGKPLSEQIYPWLISDFALSRRGDGAILERPLRLLSSWTTRLLVWWSALLIIGGFWWRSMPAHHEGMTLWIALCMMLTLYIGFTCRRKLRIEMGKSIGNTQGNGWLRRSMFVSLCLFVVALSWARTEGGIDYRFNQLVTIWNDAMQDQPKRQLYRTCPDDPSSGNGKAAYCFFRNGDAKEGVELQEAIVRNFWLVWTLDDLTETFDASWLGQAIRSVSDWRLFPSADLVGVNLIPDSGDLLDHTTERRRFRKAWCDRQGMNTETCGRLYTAVEPAPDHLDQRRDSWCGERSISIGSDCTTYFRNLDDEFRDEWEQLWTSRTGALGRLDLSGADLRRADLKRAFLIGVKLTKARMEGADLREARMDGADLAEARMEGANLRRARMEGANLSWARMEDMDLRQAWMDGANLIQARMEGADLWRVRMERADLWRARMHGANLRWARLERADLWEAQMAGATFHSADLNSVALTVTFKDTSVRAADLRSDDVTQQVLNNVFGDVATKVPDGLVVPDHWDDKTIKWFENDTKFEEWLRERQATTNGN